MPIINLRDSVVHYDDVHFPTASSLPSSPSTERTIVFIHGLGSSQNFYFPLIPLLKGKNRCILFDTPGSGRSPLPAVTLSVRTLAAMVFELLESLKVDNRATVVGHSMGCLVALHMAQLMPEKIHGLVLLGPVKPSPIIAKVFSERIETVKQGGMEAMANTIPNNAVGSRATPLQKAFIRELLLGQNVDGYSALCNAIATAELGDLGLVKMPTLIIAGKEDRSAPLDGCRKMMEELGEGCELKIVDGVGHWHVIESADDMAAHIMEFLDKT